MGDYYTLFGGAQVLNIHNDLCSDSYLSNPDVNSIKKYIDEKLRRKAERTYNIISGLIKWNIDKEEFVNLLLSEEE